MEIAPRRSRAPSVLALAAMLVAAAAPSRGAPAVALVADPPAHPARVLGRHVESGYETLVVSVDAGACTDPWNRGWQVRLDSAPGEPVPWSGVATQPPDVSERPPAGAPGARPTLTLVVRRVAAPADLPAKPPALLHVYPPAHCGPSTEQHLRFALPETSGMPDDPLALSTYLIELGQKLRFGSPFGSFAQARMHALAEERFKASTPAAPPRPSRQTLRKLGVVGFGHHDVGTAPARPAPAGPRRSSSDLARLMATTADATSLQEMLQQERRLAALTAGESATTAIDKLVGPTFPARPWRDLMAGVARPVPAEPLADAAPADFYFARFVGLPHVLRLLDGLDGWLARATALAGSLAAGSGFADATPIDRALGVRYLTQLGLPSGARAVSLASAIPGEVAVVGSDPYLREGSDLTLIWRPRADARRGPAAAPAENVAQDRERPLAAALMDLAAAHGGVIAADSEEGGVVVHAAHSPDGAIRRYRASAGGFELLSNSARAVRRVLAAIAGHTPRLGDELAFRYLLARDGATPADGLFFAGDRFVARVVSARQKVLEARRQLALGELETPGLAALLFGWMNGRVPASVDELVASGLLSRQELAHSSGEAFAWTPGAPARSSWGTPAALTPLIDLQAPSVVTATERDAYRIFVEGYERDWHANVAPVAVRVAWKGKAEEKAEEKADEKAGGNGPIDLDVRLAPFSRDDGSAYARLAQILGDARVVSGPSAAGARAAIGIGATGEPRRWLRQLLALAGRSPSGDWLGDWAMLGVDEVATGAAADIARKGRAGSLDLVDLLRSGVEGGQPLELPIYAGLAVRDEAAAALFLRNARAIALSGPVPIDWRPRGTYRGMAITRVGRRSATEAGARLPSFRPLFYAVCRSTIAVALAEETLRHRIDDCLDGRLPRLEAKPKLKRTNAGNASGVGADSGAGAQLVADLDLPSGGSLWSIAGGLVEKVAASDAGTNLAEAISRGAPGLDAAGARALATAYLGGAPVTPEGAPDRPLEPGLRAWLDALMRARLEITLDSEPSPAAGAPILSAHLHVTARRSYR